MSAMVRRTAKNSADINAALMELAQRKGGRLHAQDVVEAARAEDSPLHHRFEWDDSKAAEEWRYWQARAMISVAVNIIPTKNANKVTRAFVSLSIDRGHQGGYRVMTDVLSNDTLRQQLLDDALEQMGSFRVKFAAIEELGNVFNEMRRAEEKIKPKTAKERPVQVHVKM